MHPYFIRFNFPFVAAYMLVKEMDDIQFPYIFQMVLTDTTFVQINTSDSATVRFVSS